VSELNRRLVLAQRPSGLVNDSTVRLETEPAPRPADGEALVKVRYLSIDPTIRTWMDDVPSYLPPIQLDEVIRSGGVGEVVESRTDAYRPGQLLFGMTGWQDFVIVDDGPRAMTVLPDGVAPGVAIGILGVTGMTAYFGLIDVGQVKDGDVVVVSGAAGATGSAAGQIAKIKGAGKVVGIAGGAEKCAYIVDELGFDEAIDYKNEHVSARLRDACPDGVDLYFDNVGGSILNDCLGRLALRGRVVLCDLHIQRRRSAAGPEQLPQPAGPARTYGGLRHTRLPRPLPRRADGGRGLDRRGEDQVRRTPRQWAGERARGAQSVVHRRQYRQGDRRALKCPAATLH
jgi:NADPH-dependent curcumin reductase CurA